MGIIALKPEDKTVPTSGLMEIVLAPVTAQVIVVFSPNVIVSGLAEKVRIDGGPVVIAALVVGAMLVVSTVTITDLVTEL